MRPPKDPESHPPPGFALTHRADRCYTLDTDRISVLPRVLCVLSSQPGPPCRRGGMADAPDSKSGGGNPMVVRLHSSAPGSRATSDFLFAADAYPPEAGTRVNVDGSCAKRT